MVYPKAGKRPRRANIHPEREVKTMMYYAPKGNPYFTRSEALRRLHELIEAEGWRGELVNLSYEEMPDNSTATPYINNYHEAMHALETYGGEVKAWQTVNAYELEQYGRADTPRIDAAGVACMLWFIVVDAAADELIEAAGLDVWETITDEDAQTLCELLERLEAGEGVSE